MPSTNKVPRKANSCQLLMKISVLRTNCLLSLQRSMPTCWSLSTPSIDFKHITLAEIRLVIQDFKNHQNRIWKQSPQGPFKERHFFYHQHNQFALNLLLIHRDTSLLSSLSKVAEKSRLEDTNDIPPNCQHNPTI